MSLTKNKLYVYEYNVLTEQYTFIFSRYNVFDEYELSVVPKIEGGSAIGTDDQSGQLIRGRLETTEKVRF